MALEYRRRIHADSLLMAHTAQKLRNGLQTASEDFVVVVATGIARKFQPCALVGIIIGESADHDGACAGKQERGIATHVGIALKIGHGAVTPLAYP